jgi:hypothetical protein
MDPLHLAIAFVPLAMYLLVLGGINLGSRPFLTTGTRDSLALGLGLAGMVVAGPMELFLPERAAQTFGVYSWILMILLYLLTVVLIVLMSRPRLVIYNVTRDELRPLLEQAVKGVDPDASWADDTFVLPHVAVQLHVESFSALRNVSLVAVGHRQSWQGWRQLEQTLAGMLRETRCGPNPYGMTLVLMGVAMAGLSTYWLAQGRQTVVQALRDMLRL